MENTKEKQTLNTISFQLESKLKRTEAKQIAFVPKFNCKEKDELGNETKYNGQIYVSLKDLYITDTYFACVDNLLLNVPFEVIKGLTMATLKAYFTGKSIIGCGCSVSGYKGVIDSVNEDLTFNIRLERQLHYIIQD